MSKSKKYMIWLGIIITLIAGTVYTVRKEYGFDGDYYFSPLGRQDNLSVTKDGKVIIAATVIDLDKIPGYFVGLRLPVEYLECEGGRAYNIRIRNEENYFILATDTGAVFEYRSRQMFEDKLQALGISDQITLDYSRFKDLWRSFSRSYSQVDWDDCVENTDY